jgi:hypothetical protein
VIHECDHCQMVKETWYSIWDSRDEKSRYLWPISLVTLDITRPPPKTKNRTKYVLIIIDHYSMWCEVKSIRNTLLLLLLSLCKRKSFVDLECPSMCSLIMAENGWWDLTLCVRTMVLCINSQYHSGCNVTI